MNTLRKSMVLVAFISFVSLSNFSSSAETEPGNAEASAAEQSPIMDSGMRVYRDPQSGKLVGQPVTDEQKAAAQQPLEAQNFSSEGLREQVLPNGTVLLDLKERYQMTTVVHRTADGRLVTECTDDAHHALAAHTHAQATVANGGEEK